MEKNEAGKVARNEEMKSSHYKNGVQEGFTEQTIEQKLEEAEGVSHIGNQGKSVLSRGKKALRQECPKEAFVLGAGQQGRGWQEECLRVTWGPRSCRKHYKDLGFSAECGGKLLKDSELRSDMN